MVVLLMILQMTLALPDPGIKMNMKQMVNSNDVLDDDDIALVGKCHHKPHICPTVPCEPCTTLDSTTPPTTEATTPTSTPAPVTPSPIIEACGSKGGAVIGNECVFFSEIDDEISWQDANERCLQKYGPLSTPADPYALRDYVDKDNYPKYIGYACEDQELLLACPAGHLINVTYANYGRTSNDICPEAGTQWPVDCRSQTSLQVVTDRCSGQRSCDVTASNTAFGNPCGNVPKYLEVHWACELASDEDEFWVGGYRLPNKNSFEWLNVTEISSDPRKFPWAPNQPSDSRVGMSCLVVNGRTNGYEDQDCSTPHRYACRLDACGLLGGATVGYQCIKVSQGLLEWGNASEACASATDGGRLLVPAYPQLLIDYVKSIYGSGRDYFWVAGLQTDYSNEDSWFWVDGQRIPLGADNFPWADGEPNNWHGPEHCLDLESEFYGYNDARCDETHKYICELETSTPQRSTPVQFVIPQVSSGKYIGPNTVFPNIQDNDNLTLHFILDHNMLMTFDIVDDIWGYIRHVASGKILTPFNNGTDRSPMNPKDGTQVVLTSDRRPWSLFALDQYQNRIVHRSGKFISSQGRYVTITGDESENQTMEFQFMNPDNPDLEVLPYGYPVISGDWQLVFSVLNPDSTHTYSAKVTVGRSEDLSSSHGFKYGFEIAKSSSTSSSSSSSGYSYGSGYSSSSNYNYGSGYSYSSNFGSSASSRSSCSSNFWGTHQSCSGSSSYSGHSSDSGSSYGSGSSSSSGSTSGSGSSSSSSSSSSSGTSTTNSMLEEMKQASADTWMSSNTRDLSFTVDAGKSVAVWQRIFIAEHQGHKAVHLSNMFADTDSSRLNPSNFNTQKRRFI